VSASAQLSRLGSAEEAGFAAHQTLPDGKAGIRRHWAPVALTASPRLQEAKLYASDFRAADLPGWPSKTAHAILVRAPSATHVYTGMDLARLAGAMKALGRGDRGRSRENRHPCSCILYRRSVLPGRQDAAVYGSPVALLIFEQFDALRSGAASAARWNFREIRLRNGPRREA